MENLNYSQAEQNRTIVKFSTSHNAGVTPTHLTRNAIGYVVSGELYILNDDRSLRVEAGDLFLMGQGSHHIEMIPAQGGCYEQITFYFTAEHMQQIVAMLEIGASLNSTLRNRASAEDHRHTNNAMAITPTKILRSLFIGTNSLYELGGFANDVESARLRLAEIVHAIFAYESDAFKMKVIETLDRERANFERVIYNNILNDISVDQLSRECNKSLTSFKKEFKEIFGLPPHQWYLRQRLGYAKLLLNTTRDSIMQVGTTCAFPNTSHFIKLFKRHYGTTPAAYRAHGVGGY